MNAVIFSAALLLGVGGFTVFALWESLRPPGGPVRVAGLQVELATTPSPARVGLNQVEVALQQGREPVVEARVELRYVLDPLASMNPMALAMAEPLGDGRYRAEVRFDRPGPWQLTVLVKRPGRPDAEANYTFNLRPDPSAVIAGEVRLAPGLAGRMRPGAVLFVFARHGPGPPVAARRFTDPRFPLAFSLSQGDAMLGGSPFAGDLEVVARVKMDGRAGTPEAGDLEGRASGPVPVGTRDLVVTLDTVW